MDNLFDMDMALDTSEYWNDSVLSSEIKDSDSSDTEESEDIFTKIMMMPTLQISGDEDEDNSTNVCTVCMEGFKSSSGGEGEGKIIPCGHVYHVDCIAQWLSLYTSCPLCRCVVSGNTKMYICEDS